MSYVELKDTAPLDYKVPGLLIAGEWREGRLARRQAVINPATGQALGSLSLADHRDLDEVIAATSAGFATWRRVPAWQRGEILAGTAQRMRERAETIATWLTLEQGKPLAESRAETLMAAAIIQWYGEEARRGYGRIVPSRLPDSEMLVYKEPVGPCAAFSPWNFPLVLSSRKLAGALAAGCSVVLKAAEEAPTAVAAMVACFHEAGVAPGAIQLVYGEPAEVSATLLASPVVRKLSFTGSVPVGKHLARLAADQLQRVTLELGGHAPVLVCDDANLEAAVAQLVAGKFRNAGQACLAPTRMFVQRGVYDEFLERFTAAVLALRVGDGLDPASQMGPLANARRLEAMQPLVDDALARGARLLCGGHPLERPGCFYAPTVLADVPDDAQVMNIEPFGPIAPCTSFETLDDAIARANGTAYGLSAFVFTDSASRQRRAVQGLEAGVIAVNSLAVSNPETPFGGMKHSGYGSESGIEGLEAYQHTKFVHAQSAFAAA